MKSKIKSVLTVLFGVFLVAFSVSVFYAPNKVVSGGLSGFSTILLHTANIPLSVTNAVANIILVLLGIRILGKDFIIKGQRAAFCGNLTCYSGNCFWTDHRKLQISFFVGNAVHGKNV